MAARLDNIPPETLRTEFSDILLGFWNTVFNGGDSNK